MLNVLLIYEYVMQPDDFKLQLVTKHLRSTHFYCVWCGSGYKGKHFPLLSIVHAYIHSQWLGLYLFVLGDLCEGIKVAPINKFYLFFVNE